MVTKSENFTQQGKLLAIVSPKLVERANDLGLDIFKGPLTSQQVKLLGLSEAQQSLSQTSKGGIPVNFKVYNSVSDVYEYGKTILEIIIYVLFDNRKKWEGSMLSCTF